MKNCFAIFLLPIKFEINLDLLEQKYFSFQKQFHPDKAGINEIESSMDINEAYEILKNPLRRAIHILQLQNIDIENDENTTKPDISTLEEVLEIQEKIPTLNEDEVFALKKQLSLQIKSLLENVAFNLDNKAFIKAAQIVIKVKYLNKILQDLKK